MKLLFTLLCISTQQDLAGSNIVSTIVSCCADDLSGDAELLVQVEHDPGEVGTSLLDFYLLYAQDSIFSVEVDRVDIMHCHSNKGPVVGAPAVCCGRHIADFCQEIGQDAFGLLSSHGYVPAELPPGRDNEVWIQQFQKIPQGRRVCQVSGHNVFDEEVIVEIKGLFLVKFLFQSVLDAVLFLRRRKDPAF